MEKKSVELLFKNIEKPGVDLSGTYIELPSKLMVRNSSGRYIDAPLYAVVNFKTKHSVFDSFGFHHPAHRKLKDLS